MQWPTVPLADLAANVRNACVGGPFGSDLTRKDYVEHPGVPVIRGSNLSEEGEFFDKDFVYVTHDKARSLAANLARPGDIVFTQRGTIGQVAQVPASATHAEYLISQSQMKLTADASRVEPRYVVHYFRSPAVLRHLEGNTLATGVPHINLTILRKVSVPLPPLTEQRRIADILDQADALRQKRRAAIAQLDTLTQSIFLDMFGDPVTNPKRWSVTPFSEVLEVPLRNGVSPSSTGEVEFRVLTLSAVTGARFNQSAWKEGLFGSHPPANQRVYKTDFLVCRGNGNRSLVGKGYFPTSDMTDTAFPDTVIAARIRRDALEPVFLEAIWGTALVRRQIEESARTTNGTYKVNQSALERVRILVPPIQKQVEFAERIYATAASMSAALGSLAHLDALFASLQHRAFRGEL